VLWLPPFAFQLDSRDLVTKLSIDGLSIGETGFTNVAAGANSLTVWLWIKN